MLARIAMRPFPAPSQPLRNQEDTLEVSADQMQLGCCVTDLSRDLNLSASEILYASSDGTFNDIDKAYGDDFNEGDNEIILCFIKGLETNCNNDPQPHALDLRGGAGGSNATKKKLEMKGLMERMRRTLESAQFNDALKADLAECLQEMEKIVNMQDEELTF